MTQGMVEGSAVRRFDQRPLLVFWEMTKACQLACFHCRADAQLVGGSDELTTEEGRGLIDELASLGRPRPILILTGGDCLMRDDIIELASYAGSMNVPVAIAPSVTPQTLIFDAPIAARCWRKECLTQPGWRNRFDA